MPGVASPDPKVTEGDVADGGDEHPAEIRTARTAIKRAGITMHLHRRQNIRRQ